MKKSLFFLAVAAVALAACSSDDTIAENSNVGKNQQKEIAFKAFATPTTRAAVHGTSMPDQILYVAAYQAAATSPATVGNYFEKTAFKKNYQGGSVMAEGDGVWGGDPARYYPLSAATLNFLAVTGKEGSTDIGSHVVFNATNYAQDVTVAYTSANSYSKTSQVDIMYGVGQGVVSQSGNGLTFAGSGTTSTENVAMSFNHALALLNFQVKAAAGQAGLIQVNSITVNGASYNGTLEVKNANYAATTTAATTQPKILWSPADAEANLVTGISGYTLTESFYPDNSASNWANLMIIPSDTYDATDNSTDDPIQRGFNSFTINYTVKAQTGFAAQTYEYTYWPSGTVNTPTNVQEGKIYTYQITLTLHEIRVEPSVTNWTGSPAAVNI